MCLPVGLVLSFQRYVRPASGLVEELPASLGALPAGLCAMDGLIVPLAAGEALWIGLGLALPARGLSLQLGVELGTGDMRDAIAGQPWRAGTAACIEVPATPRVAGFRRADGRTAAFARPGADGCGCVRLALRVAAGNISAETPELSVHLVDYGNFSAQSGLAAPAPLDMQAGYQGWRLP